MTSFRDLHRKGDPLMMINVWDRGSAKMMQSMGAKALATSSAAHAFTMGLPDGGTISRDDALAHAAELMSVVSVPMQGDFENGFGDDPDTCAETVRLAAEIGLAGICIEDIKLPSDDAYDFDLAVERIRAASAAARALPYDFMLTARADGIMTGVYDTHEAIKRVQAFDMAGADCLYVPLPPDMGALERIIKSSEKPVNALIAGHFTTQTRAAMAAIGVARFSVGSSLARTTHRVLQDNGLAMLAGDFSPLGDAASGAAIDALLTKDV